MTTKWEGSSGVRDYQNTIKAPKLESIDLDKRKGCNHPDIKLGESYLILFDGHFHAGFSSKTWYGWCIDAVFDAGVQLDSINIQAIWRIVPKKKPKKSQIVEKCKGECKGILVYLKSCSGDLRDGIRRDRWCPKCKVIWGCSASGLHSIGSSKKKPDYL